MAEPGIKGFCVVGLKEVLEIEKLFSSCWIFFRSRTEMPSVFWYCATKPSHIPTVCPRNCFPFMNLYSSRMDSIVPIRQVSAYLFLSCTPRLLKKSKGSKAVRVDAFSLTTNPVGSYTSSHPMCTGDRMR